MRPASGPFMTLLLRRVMDVSAALIAVLLLAPVFVVAALLIWMEDGRPILFRQVRIGRRGKPFTMWKFRTMRNGQEGIRLTVRDDARVTPIGARLRAFKLDELPQLFHVISGSMSMIGPRPEVPEYVSPGDDLWRRVLEHRPGITDLASLRFRNEETILGPVADPEAYYRSVLIPEKLRLNLRYQKSRSLWRDIKLLWMTARYSFFPHGFQIQQALKSLGALE